MNTSEELTHIANSTVMELEAPSLNPIEWINNQLNIESVSKTPEGAWQGAEILVCYGGPTVRVFTRYNSVEASWGTNHITRNFDDGGRLNDLLEELFN